MPVAAFVVGQRRIDGRVVEVQHFLAGITVVVFGDEVLDRRGERRAIALGDEANPGVDRFLHLNERLLGVELVVVGDHLELTAENAALRIGRVGKIIKCFQADLADARPTAGQWVDIRKFDAVPSRRRHRGDDGGDSGAKHGYDARRHRDPPVFIILRDRARLAHCFLAARYRQELSVAGGKQKRRRNTLRIEVVMTTILKTPAERFANLPGFAWHGYSRYDLPGYSGLAMSYLDEGPRTAPVFLCLHGQPTWSYLYRRMMPHFLATGSRVVAPDFFGFGRSDKPADDAAYTFDFHRGSLIAFIRALDLKDVTLVVQDWGGLLGLTLPMEMPERFSRLIVMNTALPTGEVPLPKGFLDWRDFSNSQPDMAIGRLMARACPHLTAAEVAAYDAPYPDASYKAGVRRFPNLVPEFPDSDGAAIERAAREFWRNTWNGRSVMAIGMADPVLGAPVMRALHRDIRGCPLPLEFAEAGHFVQEWLS